MDSSCTKRVPIITKYSQVFEFTHSALPKTGPYTHTRFFCICSACFKNEVSKYPHLASFFQLYRSADLEDAAIQIPFERATCAFWLPVVKEVFYQQCVPGDTIQPLVDVAQDLYLVSCPGNTHRIGGEMYTSAAIPNCTFCSRCYKIYLESEFKQHFSKTRRQSTLRWNCAIGQDPGYIHDMLLVNLDSKGVNFEQIAEAINSTLEIPSCRGEGQSIACRPDGLVYVWQYTQHGSGLGVCEECYFGTIKSTPLAAYFTPIIVNPSMTTCYCDLAQKASKFLMKIAIRKGRVRIWYDGLAAFTNLPKCEGNNGVPEELVEQQRQAFGPVANWHHVIGHPVLEICPNCFHSFVASLGQGDIFTTITRQLVSGVVRVCNFSDGNTGVSSLERKDFPNTLYWRGTFLRTALEISSESNSPFDITPFPSIAVEFAKMGPPCGSNVRGFTRQNERRFYGRVAANGNDINDCSIAMCQECWYNYIKDTYLAPFLGTDVTAIIYGYQEEVKCGPYSTRSKAVLHQAAVAQDWTIFARHWKNRAAVNTRVFTLIPALKKQFEMQQSAQFNKMMYAISARTNAITGEIGLGPTPTWNYGNSVLGMGYYSSAGVNAAMLQRDADNTPGGDPMLIVQIGQLEMEWRAVE